MTRAWLIAVVLSACAPTPADLLIAGQWSAAARLAVKDRALCEPALACSAAVQILAADGAKRSMVAPTERACALPLPVRSAVPILSLDGFIALGDAAAKIAADVLAEHERVRVQVLSQATADRLYILSRCGQ